jgi:hypothetical protein
MGEMRNNLLRAARRSIGLFEGSRDSTHLLFDNSRLEVKALGSGLRQEPQNLDFLN